MKKILVTGGTGYIGSHTVVKLIEAGYEVVILDNLSNSKASVIDRIEKITNKKPFFIEGDIRNRPLLKLIFNDHVIDAVIHFAGLKVVAESVLKPLDYYNNNVIGSLALFEEMALAGIKSLIFSSSAAVYGETSLVPITEDFPLNPINPYGHSKLMIENILHDLYKSNNTWRIARLRYFNPAGAHESGLIGQDPSDIPNSLMPYIAQVAIGKREKIYVYGTDYPTRDGSAIRDYIHVDDLASAHLAALLALNQDNFITVNLSRGQGYSVLETIHAFENIANKKIPYKATSRRKGDVSESFADRSSAMRLIGWTATKNIDDIIRDELNRTQQKT